MGLPGLTEPAQSMPAPEIPESRKRYPVPVKVKPGEELLSVDVFEEAPGGIAVTVGYSCPFNARKIGVLLVDDSPDALRRAAGLRLQFVPNWHEVPRGRGKVTFQIRGKAPTTEWLLAWIEDVAEDCPRIVRKAATDSLLPALLRLQFLVRNYTRGLTHESSPESLR